MATIEPLLPLDSSRDSSAGHLRPAETAWHLMVLDGEIDLSASPLLTSTLMEVAGRSETNVGVIVDLSSVDFIDSTGLNTIITAREHLRSSGRDLVVRNPSATVVWMLKIFGLSQMVESPDDRCHWRPAC